MEQAFRACFIISAHLTVGVLGQSYSYSILPYSAKSDYGYQDYANEPSDNDRLPDYGLDYSAYGLDYSNPAPDYRGNKHFF